VHLKLTVGLAAAAFAAFALVATAGAARGDDQPPAVSGNQLSTMSWCRSEGDRCQ